MKLDSDLLTEHYAFALEYAQEVYPKAQIEVIPDNKLQDFGPKWTLEIEGNRVIMTAHLLKSERGEAWKKLDYTIDVEV